MLLLRQPLVQTHPPIAGRSKTRGRRCGAQAQRGSESRMSRQGGYLQLRVLGQRRSMPWYQRCACRRRRWACGSAQTQWVSQTAQATPPRSTIGQHVTTRLVPKAALYRAPRAAVSRPCQFLCAPRGLRVDTAATPNPVDGTNSCTAVRNTAVGLEGGTLKCGRKMQF